jgi:PAS domain-containing protein
VLVETMSEGAATLNPDSSVLFCNSRLAQMLGAPLERVLGMPLLSHVAPADTSVLTDLLEILERTLPIGGGFPGGTGRERVASSPLPSV